MTSFDVLVFCAGGAGAGKGVLCAVFGRRGNLVIRDWSLRKTRNRSDASSSLETLA
jgi:predicted ATPase